MIILHKFGTMMGLPDASPFVVKAEVLLKMAKLPYEIDLKGFNKAPKGKLPYITDDGVKVADSTFIRWHLEKKYKIDFDVALSSEQKAIGWAVEKMLEDHLYWLLLDCRWFQPQDSAKYTQELFAQVPGLLRGMVVRLVKRKLRRDFMGQGLGRHTHIERLALAQRDLDAVDCLLADNVYLFGDQPCGFDATVFSFLLGALCPAFDSEIRRYAESKTNIVAYVGRLKHEFFSS